MRLIGIKLGLCDVLIRKDLKENTWYPFGRYQEPTQENGWEWRTPEQKAAEDACQSMYQAMAEDNDESLSITVNCIVGKNGSGKSTLLDILYRIINNFSYRLIDKAWIDNTPENNPQRGHYLTHAQGLEATLFFETDGVVGSIYNCYDNVIYNYYSAAQDSRFVSEKMTKYFTKTKLENLTRHFFYTICTNYSIHSLNEEDYTPNKLLLEHTDSHIDGQWIHGLFHKNDGYVAPIAMVPFRKEKGRIDIHNENDLAKQRLSTLAVLFASKGKKFLDVYSASSLIYRFNDKAAVDYNGRFNELFYERFPINKNCSKVKTILIRQWREVLNGHFTEGFKKHPKVVKDAILNYLAYKTLKTCVHYRKYGMMIGVRALEEEEKNKGKKKIEYGFYLDTDEHKIIEVIKEITFQDTTVHVNLKIHQVLSFLQHDTYSTKYVDVPREAADKEEETRKSTAFGWNKKRVAELFTKEVDGKPKRIPFQTYDDAYLFMPPAIFEWEMCFTKDGSSDEETLSQMSSGERQLMHSISYIIYHIKNIESVTDGSYRVKYHNISLVFDEAELYYHPEYQRRFVSNLIKMLSWCHINHNIIRGVNILIVTHSPFVLSDIPLDHTLYLEDGNVASRVKETFCGNVHELLGGSFFMDYSIGDVARENVEEIIALYNNRFSQVEGASEKNKQQFIKNKTRYEYVCSIIADEYLSKKVNDMMREMNILFGDGATQKDLERQIAETEQHLALLHKLQNLQQHRKHDAEN